MAESPFPAPAPGPDSASADVSSLSPSLSPPPSPVRPVRIDPPSLDRYLRRAAGGAAPWLHEEVARRMAERLAVIRSKPATVLDWWSHAGASTGLLQQAYPQGRVVAVEPASCLASASSEPPSWWRRLLGRRTAALSDAGLPAAELPVQLLWANMMLHWVDDLPALLQRWHAALQQDGFLMFSCFGPDTLRELRALYQACGWGAVGSPWTDMHDLGDALVHAGFADPVMDMELLTLSWESPQALLTELRGLGSNTAPQRHAGLRTPRWRAELEERLGQALRGADGRLHLSFEIVYGHAFRPAPRVPVQARTEISLQSMREMTRQNRPDKAR